MRNSILGLAVFVLVCASCPGVTSPHGSHYITASTLNVRLAPSSRGKITNRLYRQNRVDVLEVRGGWARISKYYDGRTEDLSGQVARWVSAAHLSKRRPADLPQPKISADSRINGLPKVGENGLTKMDVIIIHRGARYMLDQGRCKRIEYGDKSVSKPNTYYVNCGSRNLFFKPSDLPRS